MPKTYRLTVASLALIGCASLVITGEMVPFMTLGGIAMVPGYFRFLKGRAPAPAWAIALFSGLTLLVFFFDTAVVSGEVFLAVAHMTITFQGIKSFDLRRPWDHLQVYFVSLLQLIVASEMTHSIAFGALFVLFMLMLTVAMVFSHFLQEGTLGRISVRKPVAYVSVATVVMTALFFVAIPRVPLRLFGKSHMRAVKTVGFSDRVDFGTFGEMKLDRTIIMRIELDKDVPSPYYWRGTTLDSFDGKRWSNSTFARRRLERNGDEFVLSPCERSAAIEQRIALEPVDSAVIFGLARVCAVRTDSPRVYGDDAGSVYLRGETLKGIQYTVYSSVTDRLQGQSDRRYVQLPGGSDRITDLARRITAGARSGSSRAAAVERYLRENFTYSLSTEPPPPGVGVVEDFLFSSKRGYCEHYASAMVLMLRGLGIPARIVTGFYGGERNEFGNYIIVRQSDAHSWVEAYVDAEWRRYDPTPVVAEPVPSLFSLYLDAVRMKWARYVVGYSLIDQRSLFQTLSFPFTMPRSFGLRLRSVRPPHAMVIAALAALVALYFVRKRLVRRRLEYSTVQYLTMRRLLRRHGLKVSASATPGDIVEWASGREAEGDIRELIGMYEEHRFGKKSIGREERRRYEALLAGIRRIK